MLANRLSFLRNLVIFCYFYQKYSIMSKLIFDESLLVEKEHKRNYNIILANLKEFENKFHNELIVEYLPSIKKIDLVGKNYFFDYLFRDEVNSIIDFHSDDTITEKDFLKSKLFSIQNKINYFKYNSNFKEDLNNFEKLNKIFEPQKLFTDLDSFLTLRKDLFLSVDESNHLI